MRTLGKRRKVTKQSGLRRAVNNTIETKYFRLNRVICARNWTEPALQLLPLLTIALYRSSWQFGWHITKVSGMKIFCKKECYVIRKTNILWRPETFFFPFCWRTSGFSRNFVKGQQQNLTSWLVYFSPTNVRKNLKWKCIRVKKSDWKS
jgi:hypothetical protein